MEHESWRTRAPFGCHRLEIQGSVAPDDTPRRFKGRDLFSIPQKYPTKSLCATDGAPPAKEGGHISIRATNPGRPDLCIPGASCAPTCAKRKKHEHIQISSVRGQRQPLVEAAVRNHRMAVLLGRPDHVHGVGPSGPRHELINPLRVHRAARNRQRDGHLEGQCDHQQGQK